MYRQIRYASGVQYQWKESLSVGEQFVYADYGDAKIKNDILRGEYERNDIFFFALIANWKFWKKMLFKHNLSKIYILDYVAPSTIFRK